MGASLFLLEGTFMAALSALGTATTLTAGGFLLHQKGYAGGDGKKILSRFNQQVAVPAFFFSKMIFCEEEVQVEGSGSVCKGSVWDEIGSVWILFVWPLYVVGMGMILGYTASVLSSTPKWQIPSTTVAVALSNSFSLPITLLAVIDETHLVTGGDMAQYLSIYMILQPILMWSIGGCFLTPVESDRIAAEAAISHTHNLDDENPNNAQNTETTQLLADPVSDQVRPGKLTTPLDILSKALQPPVIAAVVGLIVAAIPWLRYLFVLHDSIFSWLYLGLVTVGHAVIPMSMTILGINLSMSATRGNSSNNNTSGSSVLVSLKTLVAVVVSRMVIMPIVGLVSVWGLGKTSILSQSTVSSALYFVLLIVFITPTANTVLVMVELADGMREGMARILGWQYLLSPILLTCSITLVLQLAISMVAEDTTEDTTTALND